MADVCSYCGKLNGWHHWQCPSLESWFGLQEHQRPLMFLTHDEEPDAVRVIDTAVLETLPEVE